MLKMTENAEFKPPQGNQPVDPDDDPRYQIWQDMNNPRYNSDIDPDFDDKKRINEAELSGIDEVLSHFEKLRKAERIKIYNELQ